MYDLTIEIPIQHLPLLNLAGEQVATLHDAPVSAVAEEIKKQRDCGWAFERTVRDAFKPDVVMVMFKKASA